MYANSKEHFKFMNNINKNPIQIKLQLSFETQPPNNCKQALQFHIDYAFFTDPRFTVTFTVGRACRFA